VLSPTPPPVEVTRAASEIRSTSATVNGTVNTNGEQLSDCHFLISPAPPGGATAPCAEQVAVADSPAPVSALLQGLSPATTYTVKLVAANLAGQTSGSPVTFTTLPEAPVISKLKVHGKPRKKTITLRLSQPATLNFTFARKKGKKYVVVRMSMSASGKQGANKIRFHGNALKPGSYQVTAVATNSVGESSSPARATFMLV
jgi:hypothetical protein